MVQQVLEERRLATQERIFQILFESDEVTWKQLIFGLIEAEEMNPWDIDISLIAQKFLEMLKTLKQMDFRISGKIVLASAILLKMKSNKLMDEEIAALDALINEPEEITLLDELPLPAPLLPGEEGGRPRLLPRTPQPRKRKVSVYDLVEALEKVLETAAQRRKEAPRLIKEAKVPEKKVEISTLIKEVYEKVRGHYETREELLTFDQLVPSDNREDKVLTFIPLLHLDFQRKVDVLQKEHFGRITIALLSQEAGGAR